MADEVKKVAETAVYKNSTTVFSMTAKCVPDADKLLSETSKVRLFINDFSNGKGDSAIKVWIHLDLPKFYIWCERVRQTWNFNDFDLGFGKPMLKIYGSNEKDKNGRVPAFKLTVERNNDKNYPWYIKIENGTAVPAPGKVRGSFYGKEFNAEAKASVRLSDEDMLCMTETVSGYISSYRQCVAEEVFKKNIAEQLSGKTVAPQPMPQGKTAVGATKPPQEENGNKKTEGTMDIIVSKEFWPIGDYFHSKFLSKWKEYECKIAKEDYGAMKEALEKSFKDGETITVYGKKLPGENAILITGMA